MKEIRVFDLNSLKFVDTKVSQEAHNTIQFCKAHVEKEFGTTKPKKKKDKTSWIVTAISFLFDLLLG